MRLGMSSAGFFGRMETEEAAANLRHYPLDTCEVFVQTFSEYTGAFGQIIRNNLGGMDCVSIHPKGTQFEGELFSRSPRQTQDAFRLLAGVCEAGKALGARYYVMHGPGCIRTRRTPIQIYEMADRMQRIVETASAYGIRVLWQNVSWCTLRSPQDVRQVLSVMPDQGFVLDVKQAIESSVSPLDLIDAMGANLCHVHALDKGPTGYCLPGHGNTDWQEVFHALKYQVFDGAVILQPYEPQTRDDMALRRSLDYLREMMV